MPLSFFFWNSLGSLEFKKGVVCKSDLEAHQRETHEIGDYQGVHGEEWLEEQK